MNISRPDHRDIIGHLKPSFENRPHRANRNRIVVTKYSIRNWTQLQETARSVIPAVICVSSRDHVSRLYRQTTFLQRKMVSLQAFRRDPDVWTTQVRNTAAPLFDKVFCRQLPDRTIVGSHERRIHSLNWPVNQYKRHFSGSNPLEQLDTAEGLNRRDNQAIDLSGQERIGLAYFQRRVLLEI